MSSVKLRLNKNRLLKDGTYPLVIQVIRNRQKKQISTHYYIRSCEFDKHTEKIVHVSTINTVKQVKKINSTLSEMKDEVKDILNMLEKSNPYYTIDEFLKFYKSRDAKDDFFYFMDEQIEIKNKMKKTGTAKAYKSTLNSLKKFEKADFLPYDRIDSSYVEKYIQYLIMEDDCPNTIGFYIRNFRAVYNRCMKEHGDGGKNPFDGVRTKIEKTNKRALPKAVIAEIDQLDLSSEPLKEHARDLFSFSFNAMGMSFVDILKLTKKNLMDDDTIIYYRTKTNQLIKVPLNDRAKELINRYHTTDSDYLFSFMDTGDDIPFYVTYRAELGRVNRQLKKIGKTIGLKHPLTTYVARHSWAQAANQAGAPVTLISTGLGHSSLKTTQIYLDDFNLDTIKQMNDCVTCM